MFRLFGIVVFLVLIISPVLLRFGVLADAGVFREFIELEVKAFGMLVEFVHNLIYGTP
jgi:hypothetical protein